MRRPRWRRLKEKCGVPIESAAECCSSQLPQIAFLIGDECFRCGNKVPLLVPLLPKNSENRNRKRNHGSTFGSSSSTTRRSLRGIASRFGRASLDRAENIHHENDYGPGSSKDSERPSRNGAICYAPSINGISEECAPTTHQPRNKGASTAQHGTSAVNHRHPKPQALGMVPCSSLRSELHKLTSPATGQAPARCRTTSEQTSNKSGKI